MTANTGNIVKTAFAAAAICAFAAPAKPANAQYMLGRIGGSVVIPGAYAGYNGGINVMSPTFNPAVFYANVTFAGRPGVGPIVQNGHVVAYAAPTRFGTAAAVRPGVPASMGVNLLTNPAMVPGQIIVTPAINTPSTMMPRAPMATVPGAPFFGLPPAYPGFVLDHRVVGRAR